MKRLITAIVMVGSSISSFADQDGCPEFKYKNYFACVKAESYEAARGQSNEFDQADISIHSLTSSQASIEIDYGPYGPHQFKQNLGDKIVETTLLQEKTKMTKITVIACENETTKFNHYLTTEMNVMDDYEIEEFGKDFNGSITKKVLKIKQQNQYTLIGENQPSMEQGFEISLMNGDSDNFLILKEKVIHPDQTQDVTLYSCFKNNYLDDL